MTYSKISLLVAGLAVLCQAAAGQTVNDFGADKDSDKDKGKATASAVNTPLPALPSLYVLGPDDQIMIQGLHADEIVNKPVRVDQNGEVKLPLVGVLHAGGLTVRNFESELNHSLAKYVRDPEMSVSITEPRSQPVAVAGAVNSPGVHQIQGRKSLVEMLSLAGGLRTDAGYSVQITRQMEWGILPL